MDRDQKPHDHGTACAGIVAMAKDNDQCGVGVAFDSNIGGELYIIVSGIDRHTCFQITQYVNINRNVISTHLTHV